MPNLEHHSATEITSLNCEGCRNPGLLPFEFTMAFQPIVDVRTLRPVAYEALVRGRDGESAASILSQVDDSNRYRFDQACRVKAIELAVRLGLGKHDDCKLSINFLPNAVYRPASCIRATLEATERFGLSHSRLIFEVTEGEKVRDSAHLQSIFEEYKRHGMMTAIDDFGAGYAGLNLLAQFQPHIIKMDMELTRGIADDPVRQAIVEAVCLACKKLGIRIIAEGIETQSEADLLTELGVTWHQGYLYAKPEIEALRLLHGNFA
ncbi:EAL domain-containing protein [Chitinimonas sp. BJB300]|uniref:EAL domain-containing protein n=1 Tax=Chitinimonas sp. BJB300 TaxID=1559339 RepID=UPI000C0DEE3B|nr:EAL domain-containing protein [Chitinimonas sp. BJB300]PHV09604.1 diguanylate phosphodiesterase [Chitinimonas sp. BJB300]TSJ83226.1 EAL domain-containing protein [Chitinimonas sp. BJB300]